MANGAEHIGAFIKRHNSSRLRFQGDVCQNGHANFPPDDVCKQCLPDEARENAVTIAANIAEKNLARYKAEMLEAQNKPEAEI